MSRPRRWLGRVRSRFAGRGRTSDALDGPRFALVTGVLAGAVSLVHLLTSWPGMAGVNFHVYYLAAGAAVSGGDLYAVAAPGFAHLPYVYPPVVALAFLPYRLLGSWQLAFAVHSVVAVAASLVLAGLLVRLAEAGGRPLPRVDRLLVAAFVVGSGHAVPSLYYGNVNPFLVLALAAGVVSLERSTAAAGASFALPAAVKVFPAAFGLWLVRLRAWRAVAAAAATGLAALGTSVALFGVAAHRAYLTEALLPRRRTAVFAGGLDPAAGYLTVRRPLSVLFPDAEPTVLVLLSGLVLAPVGAYLLAADVEDGPGGLVALHGTVAATLLFFPSYQTYFVFLFVTLVPLLYRLEPGPARTTFVAGAVVANVPVTLRSAERILGPPLEAPVLAALTPVLTLGSPRLYGVLLTLAALVRYRRDGG